MSNPEVPEPEVEVEVVDDDPEAMMERARRLARQLLETPKSEVARKGKPKRGFHTGRGGLRLKMIPPRQSADDGNIK